MFKKHKFSTKLQIIKKKILIIVRTSAIFILIFCKWKEYLTKQTDQCINFAYYVFIIASLKHK